jgi:predicted dehydrogenase
MSDGLGAVVVGTGFGARVHVPALRAAGFRVEALVGRDRERTARRAEQTGVPRAITALEEALRLPGVVAVTVATPPAEHAPVVHAAIAAGKHVVCEKPFALDAAEARAMHDAAVAAGIVHRLGFEFRWAPERATVARALAAGAVGAPRFATLVNHVALVAGSTRVMPEWWWDAARGGGWLGASGSHAIDQIRTWLGEIESVSADATLTSPRRDVAEDSFSVLFRCRNGAAGVLQQTGAAWGATAGFTRVAGTTGSLWLDGDDVYIADASGARHLPVPDDLRLPEIAANAADPRERFTHRELGPYTRLCESLRDEILGRSPAVDASPRPPTFADGLASMLVIDAIRASVVRRAWVDVGP